MLPHEVKLTGQDFEKAYEPVELIQKDANAVERAYQYNTSGISSV